MLCKIDEAGREVRLIVAVWWAILQRDIEDGSNWDEYHTGVSRNDLVSLGQRHFSSFHSSCSVLPHQLWHM